jgi:SAM-dependent methyltransferase
MTARASRPACAICGHGGRNAGTVVGRTVREPFALLHCDRCRFSWVADPLADLGAVYDRAYYEGRGADPLVDYAYEAEHPERTIRAHEWRGLLRLVQGLTSVGPGTRWLDYGSGTGGLVAYLRREAAVEAVGFETGWGAESMRRQGIPQLTIAELERAQGTFDVVTAVEVLEHVAEPMEVLRQARAALCQGGLLLVTTGNAGPYRDRLARWRYVVPEIHVSFFEPGTLDLALRSTGFTAEPRGFMTGDVDVIRFKILKNLGVRRRRSVHRAVPWSLVTRVADARLGLTAHPIGRAC